MITVEAYTSMKANLPQYMPTRSKLAYIRGYEKQEAIATQKLFGTDNTVSGFLDSLPTLLKDMQKDFPFLQTA